MIEASQQTYTRDGRLYLMGVAMVLVVMFHIVQHQEFVTPVSKLLSYVFANGWLGVDMFFLLSAYGLCYSYNSNSLTKFYWNRFVRIIPIYPLAMLIVYIEAGTPWKQICFDIIQQISGIAILNETRDVFWFMEPLILLYIFFPLFYRMCKKVHLMGVLPFLMLCILVHISLIFISDYHLQLAVKRIPVMMVGVLTYLYDKECNGRGLFFLYGGMALIAVMPLLSDMYLFVPAILLLIAKSEKKIFKRILTFIGKHSLEIYLGHIFALLVYRYSQWGYYVTIIIALILTFVIAFILYTIQKYFKVGLDSIINMGRHV